MDDCPFCLPETQGLSFVESDHFMAIYNRAPILPGHSMIIPKKHLVGFLDLSPALRFEMIELSVVAVKMLQKTFKAKHFDWTIQEGAPAGQTIPHLHLHIIPRKEMDLPSPGDWYPLLEMASAEGIIDSADRPKLNRDELFAIVEKIKQANK